MLICISVFLTFTRAVSNRVWSHRPPCRGWWRSTNTSKFAGCLTAADNETENHV